MVIREVSLIQRLEKTWANKKYEVLEKDPAIYQEIRTLLKDKQKPDEDRFMTLIERALVCEDDLGRQTNALQHVWGYFKNIATKEEKAEFETELSLWLSHQTSLLHLKRFLYTLSMKYKMTYLLDSSYFDHVKD
jgi:UV DNA damage endonuclease